MSFFRFFYDFQFFSYSIFNFAKIFYQTLRDYLRFFLKCFFAENILVFGVLKAPVCQQRYSGELCELKFNMVDFCSIFFYIAKDWNYDCIKLLVGNVRVINFWLNGRIFSYFESNTLMSAEYYADSKIMITHDFNASCILCIVQAHSSVFLWYLKRTRSKIPHGIQCLFIDHRRFVILHGIINFLQLNKFNDPLI